MGSGRGAAVGQPPRISGWPILRALLWRQRVGLFVGVVVGVVWSAGKVAVPMLTRMAIDNGINGTGSLLAWGLLIAGAGVLAGLFTALRRWYAFRESRGTEMMLREQLFEHIQQLHIAYHDHTQTGQLMSRASSDLLQIQAFVVMIPITISNLAMIAAIVVLLALSNPWLALIALSPLPLLNVLSVRFSRRIHPAVLAVQQEQAQLATVVEEAVS